KLALQLRDALVNQPAVEFELRFTGAADKAERAALTLQMRPGTDKARALIIEMGKLDLKRAFARLRPLAEYFENKARPVDDLDLPAALEIALLDGRYRPVDDDNVDFRAADELAEFVDLPLAEQRAGLRLCEWNDFRVDNVERNRRGQRHGLFKATGGDRKST